MGDVPCNPAVAQTTCCGKGWTCLTSLACEFNMDSDNPEVNNAIGELWRGSCTDGSFESAQCPQFCYGISTDYLPPVLEC